MCVGLGTHEEKATEKYVDWMMRDLDEKAYGEIMVNALNFDAENVCRMEVG